MIEWLEDQIELDPSWEFSERQLNAHIKFRPTGDKVIDKWEEQLAKGKDVDFTDIVSGDDAARIAAWLKPKKAETVDTPPVDDEWNDNYTEGSYGKPE